MFWFLECFLIRYLFGICGWVFDTWFAWVGLVTSCLDVWFEWLALVFVGFYVELCYLILILFFIVGIITLD